MMKSCDRFETAVGGGTPDRVPSVPKVFVDLAAALTGADLIGLIEDPQAVLMTLIEAGRICNADAVRQFHFPFRRLEITDTGVIELDQDGKRLGRVDIDGGLITLLDDPADFDPANPIYAAFNHFWNAHGALIRDRDDAARLTVPKKSFYVEYGCGQRQERAREAAGDLGLIGDCDTATMAFLVTLRGMSQAMIDLYDNPQLVHSLMEKGVKIAAERGKFNIDAGLRVLRINDSVGNMSVISPAQWREFVFPHFRDLCTELHRYDPEIKLYCHICGNVEPIVEDLVETGLDCIAPLDPLGGVRPDQIRQRVGDAVALMGGVDTLAFIEKSAEEIIEAGRICIREAGARGGFVLGSGCVVPRSAGVTSLQALAVACETYGRYDGDGRLIAFEAETA